MQKGDGRRKFRIIWSCIIFGEMCRKLLAICSTLRNIFYCRDEFIDSDVAKHQVAVNYLYKCIPTRLVLALLLFWGFISVYILRVNLSLAIVAMVVSSTTTQTLGHQVPAQAKCHPPEVVVSNTTDEPPGDPPPTMEGEFEWDEATQGLILGSFFWGYLLTQVPGGRLAEVYGTKRIFGWSMIAAALLAFLTPWAARIHYGALIAVRILQGVFQGVTFPSAHALVARWIPPMERSKFVAFSYMGATFGMVITMPISGMLISALGWESVFYASGCATIFWFIAWMLLVYDTPSQHPRISSKERKYIEYCLKDSAEKGESPPVPWNQMLRSTAVWAIIVSDVANNWALYTLLTQLPTYMKNILGFSIKENGFLSSLPYLSRFLFGVAMSYIADYLRSKSILTTTQTRKIFNSIAMYLPALCLVIVSYTGCNPAASVALLTLAVGFNGAMSSGYFTNHIDIAPNYAGTMLGISNGLGTVPGFLAPITVGALTNHNQSLGQWRIVFFISAAIYFVGNTLFLLFGKGKVQSWNNLNVEKSPVDEESKSKLMEDQLDMLPVKATESSA